MKKKIYLYLTGGLGNQLFQYALAKNLAIKNQSQLIIDPFSGFFTDFMHKRTLEINLLNINNINFKNLFFLFYLFRVVKKILSSKKLFYNLSFATIVDEFYNCYKYNSSINNFKVKNKLFVLGVFQSEKYFIENKLNIIREITPSASNKINYLKEKKKISENKSVAVCVRLHETLPKEQHHTAGGIVYSDFYKKALNVISKKIENPNFFFFSTQTEYVKNLLDEVSEFKKYSHRIVTPQEGFADNIDTLWLLSCFKNLIISNSTYYWWGAYFSREKFSKQLVISSNKFPNRDTNLKNWTVLK